MPRFVAAALATATLAAVGCAAQSANDDADEISIGDGKADSSAKPLGDYEEAGDEHGAYSIPRLTFLDNGNFGALEGGAGDFGGTYKLTMNRAGVHYVRLYDDTGLITRCRYELSGDVLTLSPVVTTETMETECEDETLYRVSDHPWCDIDDDCHHEGAISHPYCPGGGGDWSCDSGCQWQCP